MILHFWDSQISCNFDILGSDSFDCSLLGTDIFPKIEACPSARHYQDIGFAMMRFCWEGSFVRRAALPWCNVVDRVIWPSEWCCQDSILAKCMALPREQLCHDVGFAVCGVQPFAWHGCLCGPGPFVCHVSCHVSWCAQHRCACIKVSWCRMARGYQPSHMELDLSLYKYKDIYNSTWQERKTHDTLALKGGGVGNTTRHDRKANDTFALRGGVQ